MKLWIIYNEGMVISKIIAEMLQDRLENYINVSVGNAKMVEPHILLEEKLDYLIIGDNIGETIPSVELHNWLLEYNEFSKKIIYMLRRYQDFMLLLLILQLILSWVNFFKKI